MDKDYNINNTKAIGSLVWRWRFAQPPIGLAPSRVIPQVMARLLTPQPSVTSHVIMARANRYFDAGCPVDLCEYAAARDLWEAIGDTYTLHG
jgi:hypothetical protein